MNANRKLSLALGFLAVLFNATALFAQSAASGTIAGQVTDPQGAVLVGADLKLIDLGTSAVRTTSTNDTGRYNFINVPSGTYDLTVTKAGFTMAKVSAQKVEVGLTLTLNVAMQLGATSTTVEVQASAGAELQVMNSTVGSTISGDTLLHLPNLARDAAALSVLQVGVSPTGNVAGAASDQNVFQLDGGNNSDDMSGNASTYVPSNGFAG